jgi:hypothetical protein
MPADQSAEIGALDVIEERAKRGVSPQRRPQNPRRQIREDSMGYRSTSSAVRFTTTCVIARPSPKPQRCAAKDLVDLGKSVTMVAHRYRSTDPASRRRGIVEVS